MTIRARTAFFIFIAVFLVWFLYVERAILTPFILAAIFAYVFNPVVNFFYQKVRLPKTISIFIIYLLIMSLVVVLGFFLTRRILEESLEIRSFIDTAIATTRSQINTLPEFIKPTVKETLVSLEKSRIFSPSSLFYLFPQAVSRIVSFFIFLFSAFYFLKEGNLMLDRFLRIVPNDYKVEVEILLRKINKVLGGYLRGQIFLVVLISSVLYLALLILGVRFALTIAIFSGFAEIVPLIGPITAGAVAAIVVLISGVSNFPLTPVQAAFAIVLIYFVVRQIEDYFVIPHVMGKIADLHPLIILFAVLAGGHLWGIMGLILAVPIAAVIKIFLVYSLDKINEKSHSRTGVTKIKT